MLKFTDLNQEYPDKRLSKDRKKDFREIYDNFIKNSAKSSLADAPMWRSILHSPLSTS